MQVNLQPTFFYNIHHVKGHDHRLTQFKELKRQIETAFKGRCVNYVDDDIHLITEDEFPGNNFFHGVTCETVGPGQIDKTDIHVVVADGALYFFHSHARPVCDFKIGACIGVEQGRLPAVRVPNEANGEICLCVSHDRPPLSRRHCVSGCSPWQIGCPGRSQS